MSDQPTPEQERAAREAAGRIWEEVGLRIDSRGECVERFTPFLAALLAARDQDVRERQHRATAESCMANIVSLAPPIGDGTGPGNDLRPVDEVFQAAHSGCREVRNAPPPPLSEPEEAK